MSDHVIVWDRRYDDFQAHIDPRTHCEQCGAGIRTLNHAWLAPIYCRTCFGPDYYTRPRGHSVQMNDQQEHLAEEVAACTK